MGLEFLAKYGETATITFPVVKRAVVDLAVTGDWTPVTGDTKLWKDGAGIANTTNNPAAISGTGSVNWSLVLTGLEMQCAVGDVQIVDSATKAIEDQFIKVITWGHPSAQIKSDLTPEQAPRVADVTTTAFSTQTTTHAVSMPTNVEAGDLLLAIFSNVNSDTVTTPAGWTQLHSTANGSSLRLSCYAKKADGTEGGTTVGFTTSGSQRAAGQVYRIKKGQWYGDSASSFAQSIVTGTAATGTSTAPNPPAAAPTWGKQYSLFIAIEANADGSITDTVYPANYVDRTNIVSNAASTGVSVSSVLRSQGTTSEDPGTYTITSAAWVAQTIAIRPANAVALTDGANVARILDSTTAATNAGNFWTGMVSDTGTAQAGATGSITLRSGAVATDDYYKWAAISIYAGTGAGQTRRIIGYTGSTKVALVDVNWAVTPDSTSQYQILGRIV
jgi:hypothetical protein